MTSTATPVPFTFPNLYIARDNKLILLMTNATTGMVVNSTDPADPIGNYSASWLLPDKQRYFGSVLLQG